MGMLQWTIQHGCCMTILSDAFHVYNAYFYNHVIGLKWQWMKVKLLLLAYRINGTVCPLSSFMMDFEPDKISRKSLSLDTYWYDLICIHITGADILEKPSIFIYLRISKHFIDRMFITIFTRACHRPLSWVRWIQSCFPAIHFNIIHTHAFVSYWSLFIWLSRQNPVCIPPLPIACFMVCRAWSL
jgi:hypothetical protein